LGQQILDWILSKVTSDKRKANMYCQKMID